MPTSDYRNTVHVLDFIARLDLRSALDVGAGFGRWGFLLRCHMAGGKSLTAEPAQTLNLEAVEGFAGNINPVYDAVYNRVHQGDARDVLPRLGKYDIVICGDMIEHLDKEDGRKLIEEMKRHATGALIVSVPLGECPQDAIGGNPMEVHRSTWRRADFRGQGAYLKAFRFPDLRNLEIGVIIWPLSDAAKWAVKTLRNPLRRTLVDRFSGVWKRCCP